MSSTRVCNITHYRHYPACHLGSISKDRVTQRRCLPKSATSAATLARQPHMDLASALQIADCSFLTACRCFITGKLTPPPSQGFYDLQSVTGQFTAAATTIGEHWPKQKLLDAVLTGGTVKLTRIWFVLVLIQPQYQPTAPVVTLV